MRVAFHSNQLGLRGTEIALFDYAYFNQVLLGNESVIVAPRVAIGNDSATIDRFRRQFPVCFYESWGDADGILSRERVDCLYCIKPGFNDGLTSEVCKTVVHAVFPYIEPHGAVYAYISEYLSRLTTQGASPWVPHMINLVAEDGDLRTELSIPKDAIVIGRHGGIDTFDIPFVHKVVEEFAAHHPGHYFLFLNTERFCPPAPNIIHLPPTADPRRKVRFINSCDVMLHARNGGETFGLACGEFSVRNKPVMTWAKSIHFNHIAILKEKGRYFIDGEGLTTMLEAFEPDREGDFDAYSSEYGPTPVMEKFRSVFLA